LNFYFINSGFFKSHEEERFMVRFICWVLAIGIAVGFGLPLISLTLGMAKAAIHAHEFDQMSYAKFTRTLLNAKPRVLPKNSGDSD
jgi:hypothetical protein